MGLVGGLSRKSKVKAQQHQKLTKKGNELVWVRVFGLGLNQTQTPHI